MAFQEHIWGLTGGFDGRGGGLPSHLISLLPTLPYKDSKEAQKEERCPICLDDVSLIVDGQPSLSLISPRSQYEEMDTVMGIAECGHFFHKDCFSVSTLPTAGASEF